MSVCMHPVCVCRRGHCLPAQAPCLCPHPHPTNNVLRHSHTLTHTPQYSHSGTMKVAAPYCSMRTRRWWGRRPALQRQRQRHMLVTAGAVQQHGNGQRVPARTSNKRRTQRRFLHPAKSTPHPIPQHTPPAVTDPLVGPQLPLHHGAGDEQVGAARNRGVRRVARVAHNPVRGGRARGGGGGRWVGGGRGQQSRDSNTLLLHVGGGTLKAWHHWHRAPAALLTLPPPGAAPNRPPPPLSPPTDLKLAQPRPRSSGAIFTSSVCHQSWYRLNWASLPSSSCLTGLSPVHCRSRGSTQVVGCFNTRTVGAGRSNGQG